MKRSGSVHQMDLEIVGQFDLVRNGLDRAGRSVALAYSEVTGEIYTYEERRPDKLVEIYGRVESVADARAVADACPLDPTGLTLLEAAARSLNGERYRSA